MFRGIFFRLRTYTLKSLPEDFYILKSSLTSAVFETKSLESQGEPIIPRPPRLMDLTLIFRKKYNWYFEGNGSHREITSRISKVVFYLDIMKHYN